MSPIFDFSQAVSQAASTGTTPQVFSSGIITLTATITGLPVGQYALSILPARVTDHRLVLPDPLPTTIITSSVNNGVNTVTVNAAYNLQPRVVDF